MGSLAAQHADTVSSVLNLRTSDASRSEAQTNEEQGPSEGKGDAEGWSSERKRYFAKPGTPFVFYLLYGLAQVNGIIAFDNKLLLSDGAGVYHCPKALTGVVA